MSTITHRLTYEDLLDTPEDRNRYEIVDGRMVVTPAPIPLHEQLTIRLTLHVGPFVVSQHLGQVFTAPVDVRLSPHDIVEPDFLFIRQHRLGIVGPTLIDGAPDLVVEILSPSTRERDLNQKAALYAAAGVPEYWIVDPEARTVTVLVLRHGHCEPVPIVDGHIASVVLPGLTIDPAAIFAGL
jgi:Uma2 family endonuclease